jgi:cation diffusion facilitator family transporter
MHKTLGQRDPASAFPLAHVRDDAGERRQANRAVAVSAIGLGVTGLVELLIAVVTGSVGLLGDAIHNLSDVSTSAVVFLGFRLSRRPPTERYPYGLERAEDLAGVGVAVVIWASAAFAGWQSIRKLIEHGHTTHVAAGIARAVLGIIGNQLVARYKLTVGKRINSATLIADARHSWLDALSSAGALAGLIAVAAGQPWGDPVAGLAVTTFICHVGYEVTKDVVHRLADGVDPQVITTAEAAAGSVPGVIHAHARARWTGRTLRVEIEGWVDPQLPAKDADALGRLVAGQISRQVPQAGSLTWTTRSAPALPCDFGRQKRATTAPTGSSSCVSGVTPAPRGDRVLGPPRGRHGPAPLAGVAVRAAGRARRPPQPGGPGPRWRSGPR